MPKDFFPVHPVFNWPTRWSEVFDWDSFVRVEEIVEDGTLLIRAEIPGVDPEKDVELIVDHGVLSLHVERHDEKQEPTYKRRRSEFRYGSFSRKLVLPPGASEDDVKATYMNGILEVRIPFEQYEPEVRKVPILTV
jgi:HSP20 family protein